MIQRGQLEVVQGGKAAVREVPPPDDRPPRKPIPVIPPPSYGWLWLTLGIVASLLVHGVIVYIAIKAPKLLREREDTIVRMFVVEQAPPEPEVEVEPEPEEEPDPEPEEVDYQDAVVAEAPPPDAEPEAKEPAPPVFGVSMSSTVQNGSGWGMTVGNTVGIDPEDSADPEELAEDGPPTVKYEAIDREPVVTRRHQPPYPAASKEAGIEGDVVLYLTIDANGDVVDAAVVSGPNKELNDAARAAMFKHKFRPATQGGKPVVVTRYPYIFTWIIEE